MKHWTIGNRGKRQTDLGLDDDTVSGLHASLTQTDDGRWMVEDRNSKNGTTRFIKGQWVSIRQAYVLPDERLRFGRAETTVHQLLALLPRPDQPPAQKSVISWRKDLAEAIPKVLKPTEIKENILFVFELISMPAEQIMRCAVRHRPVNPFSFMIFGGVAYTIITTTGLTLSALVMSNESQSIWSVIQNALSQTPRKALAPFVLMIIYAFISNVIPFHVFKYISLKNRHFDDFMRLRAVVNGMFWMLASFIALLLNEAHSDKSSTDPSFVQMVYILAIIAFVYASVFAVIANKHFWRISYGRTLCCYVLSNLATFTFICLVIVPIYLIVWIVSGMKPLG